jgi:hypothetical protein
MKHVWQATSTWLEIPLAVPEIVSENPIVSIPDSDRLDPRVARQRAAA